MGLNFFSAAGDVVKTGSRTVKCVTGYNLTGLLVGSEGTLGVISEIILKLIPLPEARKAMLATFARRRPGLGDRGRHHRQPHRPGHPGISGQLHHPHRRGLQPRRAAGGRRGPAAHRGGRPSRGGGGRGREGGGHLPASRAPPQVHAAKDDAERDRVWSARRAALSALAKLKPTVVLEDATVPRSKIPAMIRAIEDISQRFDLPIGTFGHAGDGNLHPTILTDRRNTAEWHRVEAAVDAIFEAALGFGGTLSGEHGIGTGQGPVHGKRGGPRAPSSTPSASRRPWTPRTSSTPGRASGRCRQLAISSQLLALGKWQVGLIGAV